MNHTPFWRGLLRTVLTLALSLFLLSLLVFVIAHYAPGDPLRAYFGDRVEKMSVDERAWAEAKLGLDRPVLTQYGIWLQNALHGDFGISYKYKMDVLEVIRTRLPYTLRLGGVGLCCCSCCRSGSVCSARGMRIRCSTAFSAAWARS